jgi:hypothetical protein
MTATVALPRQAVVRRRPSGEPPALRREARWTRWIAVLAGVVVAGLGLHALGRWTGALNTIDQAVSSRLADIRMPGVANAVRPLGLLTSMATVMGLRWLAVLVLLVQRRVRHAVVFVLTFVGMDWAVARLLHVDLPRPAATPIDPAGVYALSLPSGRCTRDHPVLQRDGRHGSEPRPPERPHGRGVCATRC